MKISKKMLIGATSVAVLGGSVALGAGLASAASSQPSSLAQQIADTFHLQTADVQNVINQHRSTSQNDRYNKAKTKLDAAVAADKLTSAQETTILGFLTTRQNDMKLTGTARKQALETLRAQVKAFIQQNPDLKKYVYSRHVI